MKLKIKLILLTILCIGIFIFMPTNKVDAANITSQYLTEKFNTIKNTYGYRDNQKYVWNDAGYFSDYCQSGGYHSNIGYYNMGYQCYAYSQDLFDQLFQKCSSCNASTTKGVNDLYVGDVVRLTYGHSIVVTDIIGDTIYYTDANANWDGVVHWGQTMSKSYLSSRIQWISHAEGNNVKTLKDDPQPSSGPTNLKITNTTTSSITLSWDAVKYATQYIAIVYPADRVNNYDWSVRTTTKTTSSTSTTITGIPEGEYYVYVHPYNNNNLGPGSASLYFRIAPIQKISLNKTSIEMRKGDKYNLSATTTPSYASTTKTLTWSTSNSSVATVSSTGVITAKGAGTCTITVKTANSKTATCKVTVSALPFTDVSTTDWYYSAVKYTYENKMISGLNTTTFAPKENLTRAMIVSILWRMENCPDNNGKSNFKDVPSNEWYAKAVKWASDKGIVHGYTSTKFGPYDKILRQDLAVILNNYANYKKKNVNVSTSLTAFKDYSKVSSYAKPAMQWAVGKSVINGNADGTLNPKGYANRAEAVCMILNYCQKIGR